MKLCFLIYTYFPFGGQQRDFMRIVKASLQRGHQIHVFAFSWEGEIPEGVNWHQVPIKGLSRQARYRYYTDYVAKALPGLEADCVLGFSKMPGLDIYFAADACFREKALTQRGSYYRFTPRYRHFSAYEQAVFGPGGKTSALLLSGLQQLAYLKHYPDCAERLHLLPPGISPDRKVEGRDQDQRAAFREELAYGADELLVLQVGSGFKVKGVDRSLRAIASLPDKLRQRVRYILVGQDRATRFLRLAKRLGLSDQVRVLPGREDIMRFFTGCDLLLHPAYEESAGYVLLEAVIAGLPVLTTASCGYANYVAQAEAGLVCDSPFTQQDLNTKLSTMLQSLQSAPWSSNGLEFGKQDDLYTMPESVVEYIERSVAARSEPTTGQIDKNANTDPIAGKSSDESEVEVST